MGNRLDLRGIHGPVEPSACPALRFMAVPAPERQLAGRGVWDRSPRRRDLQHGKPCIGGNHAGATEVIREGVTGYLVDHDDHAQLALRIRELATDASLRNRMGAAAREVVAREFSVARFAARWREVAP